MRCFIILFSILFACSDGTHAIKREKDQEKAPSLMRWSHESVEVDESDDNAYMNDHDNFIRPYFSVNYFDQGIAATTLMRVNCIDSIDASIEISNDTLFLKRDIIMTSDQRCMEYHTFKFTISNPENKRYTLISSK